MLIHVDFKENLMHNVSSIYLDKYHYAKIFGQSPCLTSDKWIFMRFEQIFLHCNTQKIEVVEYRYLHIKLGGGGCQITCLDAKSRIFSS